MPVKILNKSRAEFANVFVELFSKEISFSTIKIVLQMYLLNRLAGGCLQSISLVRRALTVVTKEAARNIGSRMSWLVGNNQPDQDVIF